MDLNIRVKYSKDELPELFSLLKHIKNRKLKRKVRIADFAVSSSEGALKVGGKR